MPHGRQVCVAKETIPARVITSSADVAGISVTRPGATYGALQCSVAYVPTTT